MLRPMIENMMGGINGGAGGMDPFGAVGGGVGGGARTGSTTTLARPPPLPTLSTAWSIKSPRVVVDQSDGGIITKSLVSGDVDASLVVKLGNKIVSFSVTGSEGVRIPVLIDSEIELVRQTMNTIDNAYKQDSVAFSDAAFTLFIRLIREHSSLQTSCLFFIRLMVLYQTLKTDSVVSAIHEVSQILKSSELSNSTATSMSLLTSGPAKFMAICSLSNYYSRRNLQENMHSEFILNSSIDIATAGIIIASNDTETTRPEVRQVAAALAHNIVLLNKESWASSVGADNNIHPHVIQLLCCSLERIEQEQDDIVLHRRLSIAYSILFHVEATRPLCLDLGFVESLNALKDSFQLSTNSRPTETNDAVNKIFTLF